MTFYYFIIIIISQLHLTALAEQDIARSFLSCIADPNFLQDLSKQLKKKMDLDLFSAQGSDPDPQHLLLGTSNLRLNQIGIITCLLHANQASDRDNKKLRTKMYPPPSSSLLLTYLIY